VLAQVVKLGEERDAARAEAAQLRERVAELERALSESVATSLWDVPPAPVRDRGEGGQG
jgi:hypothetical protein